MITITVHEGEYLELTLLGHAQAYENESEDRLEHVRVCAGVSQIGVTLMQFACEREWAGDGSGFVQMKLHPTAENTIRWDMTMRAIKLVEENYPSYVTVNHE